MSLIASDGLSLLVGDGALEENFTALRGMTITRFELSQQSVQNTAIGADAWAVSVGATDRRAVLECTALATDEAAALRIRSLAMNGNAGNFWIAASAVETMALQAVVVQYQEITQPGAVKRFTCRLESSGAVTLA